MRPSLIILAASIISLVHSCNSEEGSGNLGYSQFRGQNSQDGFTQQQRQPIFNSNNANPNFSNPPQNSTNGNGQQQPFFSDNIGDFSDVNPDDIEDGPANLDYEFEYAGRGCSHHGADGGPANTESNGVLSVKNGHHSYNLTRIRAVSGGQRERIDNAIKGGVGKDRTDHIRVGDAHNEYRDRHYDSMVYTKKIVNHRAKINNAPVELTFTNSIPINVRFGYKCSEFPNNVSYPTQLTIVNNGTTRPATMTVTTEQKGGGKCIVKTHFDIPSDTGRNGGKIYEKISLSRFIWFHYDENETNFLRRIDSESLRAGTRDNKVYRTEMSLKICKYKRNGVEVQTFNCGFTQVGCSI